MMAQTRHALQLLSAALLLSVAGAASPPDVAAQRPAAGRSLSQLIDSVLGTPPLDRSHWGIEVYDPARRRSVYRLNAQRRFIPASNLKLVVGAVALAELGPDYRFRTEVRAAAGDAAAVASRLLVVARGDPSFSSWFHANPLAPLDSLADSLAHAGLRRVAGDLVIDASYFDRELVNPTWEIGDIDWRSGARVTPLAVLEAAVPIVTVPGPRPGDPAQVTLLDPVGTFSVTAHVTTAEAGEDLKLVVSERRPGTDTLVVTGVIAVDEEPDTSYLAQSDPVRYAAHALVAALAARGIELAGEVRVIHDTMEARTLREATPRALATWASPPLRRIVAALLKPSRNWIADVLVKTLGAERRSVGSWEAGLDVERRYLIEAARIDSSAFQLRDGSGLSAQNLLTPGAIVRLLEHASRAPWGKHFRAALAAPGERGSTLETRLQGLEGQAAAKTGSITNVRTLSGYVTMADGKDWIFSILTNASGSAGGAHRRALDRLVRELAERGSKP